MYRPSSFAIVTTEIVSVWTFKLYEKTREQDAVPSDKLGVSKMIFLIK